MPTFRENLVKNPNYENGLFFNQNFYKDHISEQRLNEEVDQSKVNVCFAISSFVEVAKKVAVVALVAIPSFVILGPYMFATVFVTGVAAGVVNDIISSNESLLKRVGYQAEVNAAIDSARAYVQPAIDLLSTSALSGVAFAAMNLATGVFSSFFVYTGAFVAGKIFAEEVVAIGYDLVERHANARFEAMRTNPA